MKALPYSYWQTDILCCSSAALHSEFKEDDDTILHAGVVFLNESLQVVLCCSGVLNRRETIF